MSRNYIRYFSLSVGGGGGGLNLSQFRVKWKVSAKLNQTPALMEARVYNLSAQTARGMMQQQYVQATLEAGYRENHGVLFKGFVRQMRYGHETPTETFFDVFAQAGDKAVNVSSTNKTWPKDTTQKTILEDAVKDMGKVDQDVKIGHIGPSLDKKYPKAFTFFGMSADLVRMIGQSNNASWFISGKDNQLNMLKDDANDGIPGGDIRVNRASGMIGSPVQTTRGILIRHLINPEFDVGKFIQLDEGQGIDMMQYDLSYGSGLGNTQPAQLPEISATGRYKILAIDWVGDTRGTPWYAEIYAYSGHIPEGGQGFSNEPR